MTKDELAKLEETIAASFIRSNVLSIEEAKKHAGLAVCHVRNVLRDKQQAEADEQPDDISRHELQATIQSLKHFGGGLTSCVIGELERVCKIAVHYLEVFANAPEREAVTPAMNEDEAVEVMRLEIQSRPIYLKADKQLRAMLKDRDRPVSVYHNEETARDAARDAYRALIRKSNQIEADSTLPKTEGNKP